MATASLRRSATLPPRQGRVLVRHWLAARAPARLEARTSSPERTAPAIAGSRSARTGTARQPGLLCTPRRPRARTDHTSHSSPRHLPAAGCRAQGSPARCTPSLAHPVMPACPARPGAGLDVPRGQPSARHSSPIQSGRLPARYGPPLTRRPPYNTAGTTSKRARHVAGRYVLGGQTVSDLVVTLSDSDTCRLRSLMPSSPHTACELLG
jgi:hypothetical protein